jgi:hypothetical protein
MQLNVAVNATDESQVDIGWEEIPFDNEDNVVLLEKADDIANLTRGYGVYAIYIANLIDLAKSLRRRDGRAVWKREIAMVQVVS